MLCRRHRGSLDSSSVGWVCPLFRPLVAKLVSQLLTLQRVHVELHTSIYRLQGWGGTLFPHALRYLETAVRVVRVFALIIHASFSV